MISPSLKSLSLGLLLASSLLLGACKSDNSAQAEAPPPVAVIPDDARGHYCGMYMFEHPGPKGQVLVRDEEDPYWFSTIREVFAFKIMPDEPKTITAMYVQDLGRLQDDGDFPEDAWIEAEQAFYLIGSDYEGNMGVPDALPFGSRGDAESFQQEHGGDILAFDEVPQDFIFDTSVADMHDGHQEHDESGSGSEHGHGEAQHGGDHGHDEHAGAAS